MYKRPKVLFLSTGNSTRSQMAEGFLRALAGDRYEVMSAGLEPGELNPLAVEAMKEAGIDISHQKPKNVADSLKEHFGYVVTVCDMARERAPIFPFTPNLLHWSLEDPAAMMGTAEQNKKAFARLRDEIRAKVLTFIDQVSENDRESTKAAAG